MLAISLAVGHSVLRIIELPLLALGSWLFNSAALDEFVLVPKSNSEFGDTFAFVSRVFNPLFLALPKTFAFSDILPPLE
jgi:hypothetical protein